MTLQMPPSFITGPSLGSQLGEKLGMGISTGLQGALSTFMEEQKQFKENSALQKAFTSIPEDAPFEQKFKTIISAQGVSPETKKTALSGLLEYEKHQQQLALDRLKEQRKVAESQRESELTHKAYKEAGYELPEYIPGTPVDVYHKMALNLEKEGKTSEAKSQKLESYKGALDIVKRQRDLLKRGHLGPMIGGYGSTGRNWEVLSPSAKKEGRIDRSEYEQLGKSLITFASQVPIRNRLEFETLSNRLMDPTLPQEDIEGTLNAIEKVLQGHLTGKDKKSPKGVDLKAPNGKIYRNVPADEANEMRKLGAKLI